jgi:hypothetical protein|tara:strand:+ start:20 stop:223 length:204 start_codon:yes stop_codon:yes gene_type:complete
MAKKSRQERIQDLMSKEPQLTYLEAMKVVLTGKKRNQRGVAKGKRKSKSDAMIKVYSGGFETNRRRH